MKRALSSVALIVLATAANADGHAVGVLDVLSNYADIAEAGFADSLVTAQRLDAAIDALIASLKEQGVDVITAEAADLPIHASGHPDQDELRAMYQWVQPEVAIPVHGEAEHMDVHASLARDCGVPKSLLGRNGDLFMIRPVPGMRRQVAEVGRLGWEKGGLVRVV